MRILSTLIAFLFISVCFAQPDEIAIRAVVKSAYIEGTQNRGSLDDIRKGFHPSFRMLRLMDDTINPLPLEEWIALIEARRKEGSSTVRTEGKILAVDITGTTALVKLELHREGKLIFTDYLALYKFSEGWRIVSKTFYKHP
ncbi:MAG: nuclear transport factor 2 family protein [Cyclobacteriaceae bacterium]|nr:nuclear transport factor 2 family protein [Cyclobacteriaceae bacterium]